MAINVSGTLMVGGSPAANGQLVEIWSFDQLPTTTGQLLGTAAVAGGAGAFTFPAPDNTVHKYRALYDNGTNRGISALQAPVGPAEPVNPATTATVSIADIPDPVNGFQNITYTITPQVTGGFGATSAVLTFTLDANLVFVSVSGTGWVHSRVGQVITSERVFIPVGVGTAEPVVVVATTLNVTAVMTSTASLTANNMAAPATDNETTQVNAIPTGEGPGNVFQVPDTDAEHFAMTGRHITHCYNCQIASGNLLDEIGTMHLTASTSGAAPLYQVAAPTGWSPRVGVGFNQVAAQRFQVLTGVGPNPGATPVAFFAFARIGTPAAVRQLMYIEDAGAAVKVSVHVTAGGTLRTQCIATTNDGTVSHVDGLMHGVLLTIDTGNTTCNRYTDLEKDLGTYAATPASAPMGIGAAAGQTSFLGEIFKLYILEGADAQFTDAQAKAYIQAFGFSPPWS